MFYDNRLDGASWITSFRKKSMRFKGYDHTALTANKLDNGKLLFFFSIDYDEREDDCRL